MLNTFLIILIATITFGFGFFYPHKPATIPSPVNQPNTPLAIRQSGYHYINPLLECDNTEGIENNSELTHLKSSLTTQINQMYEKQSVSHIAVYFRDLNNGPWFGINEDSDFTPASLLKVPVMIAYLKLAEIDPTILTKKLIYDPTDNPPESPAQNIPSIQPNASYKVEELINRMITYSDNNAFNILTKEIDYNHIKQVHLDLGLKIPGVDTPEDFISVKEYTSIFRVLFNSSYLSRSMSEKALTILAKASYHDGLVAGIDPGVETAHKYGVRKGYNDVDQLHDCGIVYYPGHPYLVCIMTKGKDFNELATVLSQLSRTIFSEIQSRYPLN